MANTFSDTLKKVLQTNFGNNADTILQQSTLLKYIEKKTKSANKGAKTRGNFANLYAIYVLVEDYINQDYDQKDGYSTEYKGAQYTSLMERTHQLPFGATIQNHALNSRLNTEFAKTDVQEQPIVYDLNTSRYWFNEKLLKINIKDSGIFNIAKSIIQIIDAYVEAKQNKLDNFLETCKKLQELPKTDTTQVNNFIDKLLVPNADARLFEIVSYAILKYFYVNQHIFWGYDEKKLTKENLKLYKTGKTNANDGGIDFVMKPLGKFFQVTETLDFKKYFLDIDKIQKYAITFVVKSDKNKDELLKKIRSNAENTYSVKSVVDGYMDCIEDIINIPKLKEHFNTTITNGFLAEVLDEIQRQAQLEFQQ